MADWIYFHNLDPFIISFSENIGIRWYGMAYIAGFLCGNYFLLELLKRNRTPLSKKDIFSLVNYAIMGVLIGGRLGYCIFYQPDLWLKFSGNFPFWGILEIHKGGMASHGGILGIFLAFLIFSHIKNYSFLHLLDLSVFGGAAGIFFGRLANFINGELYGRIIQGSAPFGVQFPNEIHSWFLYQKTEKLLSLKKAAQALESIPNPFNQEKINISEALWSVWVSSQNRFTAEISSVLNKITLAAQNGNEKMIVLLQEILPIRHPSQIYQAFLEGLIPLIVVSLLWIKPRKTGWIAGCWALSYFVMRIVGEVFREPDASIGFDALGLTRGQWLSSLSLLGVIFYLFWIYRNQKSLDKY